MGDEQVWNSVDAGLVLDDAEMNNLVMVASLRPLAGCVPYDFTVPAEALTFAQARASEIGVVITDYEMRA